MVVVLVHVIFLLGLLKPLQQLIDRNLLGYDLFIPVEFQFQVPCKVFYFLSFLAFFKVRFLLNQRQFSLVVAFHLRVLDHGFEFKHRLRGINLLFLVVVLHELVAELSNDLLLLFPLEFDFLLGFILVLLLLLLLVFFLNKNG